MTPLATLPVLLTWTLTWGLVSPLGHRHEGPGGAASLESPRGLDVTREVEAGDDVTRVMEVLREASGPPESRVVVYDDTSLLGRLFNAFLFYTQGHTSFVSPLNNAVWSTPALGLILTWLLGLVIFHQYWTGNLLKRDLPGEDDLDHPNLQVAGAVVNALNQQDIKYGARSPS